jgi:hypothetical protein
MRPAADLARVDDKFARAIMAESDLTEVEVRVALTWVVDVMTTRSRFNVYHEFDKVVRHVRLSVSVPLAGLDFSLEAHGFRPLPSDQPVDRALAAITAILANETMLREYIENLPTL